MDISIHLIYINLQPSPHSSILLVQDGRTCILSAAISPTMNTVQKYSKVTESLMTLQKKGKCYCYFTNQGGLSLRSVTDLLLKDKS